MSLVVNITQKITATSAPSTVIPAPPTVIPAQAGTPQPNNSSLNTLLNLPSMGVLGGSRLRGNDGRFRASDAAQSVNDNKSPKQKVSGGALCTQ